MKTKTPFLSIDARGTIAGTVTAAKLRGRHIIKSNPRHSDAQSTDQLAERSRIVSAGTTWSRPWIKTEIRDSWERFAVYKRLKYTGYHAFEKSLLDTLQTSPDPAFPVEIRDYADGFVACSIINPITQALSLESGAWNLFAGTHPARLNLVQSKTRMLSKLFFYNLNTLGKPLYIQLIKGGIPRTGIVRLNFVTPSVQANINPYFVDDSWWSHWPRWILGGGQADYDATRAPAPHTLNQKTMHPVGSKWLSRVTVSDNWTPGAFAIQYGTVPMFVHQWAGTYEEAGTWTSTLRNFGEIIAPHTSLVEKGKLSLMELYDITWMP